MKSSTRTESLPYVKVYTDGSSPAIRRVGLMVLSVLVAVSASLMFDAADVLAAERIEIGPHPKPEPVYPHVPSNVPKTPAAEKLQKQAERVKHFEDMRRPYSVAEARMSSSLARIAGNGLGFSLPQPILVDTNGLRSFGAEFLEGARSPQQTLANERKARPDVARLIDRWQRTPIDKSFFVTGANADHPLVRELAKRIEADGGMVYFYAECAPLCSAAAVGAFFATAGNVMTSTSPAAKDSRYVALENKLIYALMGSTSGGIFFVNIAPWHALLNSLGNVEIQLPRQQLICDPDARRFYGRIC